jgi:hypothetical protein
MLCIEQLCPRITGVQRVLFQVVCKCAFCRMTNIVMSHFHIPVFYVFLDLTHFFVRFQSDAHKNNVNILTHYVFPKLYIFPEVMHCFS